MVSVFLQFEAISGAQVKLVIRPQSILKEGVVLYVWEWRGMRLERTLLTYDQGL